MRSRVKMDQYACLQVLLRNTSSGEDTHIDNLHGFIKCMQCTHLSIQCYYSEVQELFVRSLFSKTCDRGLTLVMLALATHLWIRNKLLTELNSDRGRFHYRIFHLNSNSMENVLCCNSILGYQTATILLRQKLSSQRQNLVAIMSLNWDESKLILWSWPHRLIIDRNLDFFFILLMEDA